MNKFEIRQNNQPETGDVRPERLERIRLARERMKRKIVSWLAMGITATGGAWVWQESENRSADPNHYLAYALEQEQLSPEMQSKLKDEVAYLSRTLSPSVVGELQYADEAAAARREYLKTIEHTSALEVEGFDELGMPDKELREVWSSDGYPKGTVDGNVEDVRPENAVENLLTPSNWGASTSNVPSKEGPRPIVFHYVPSASRFSKDKMFENIDFMFAHELGHRIDWFNNLRLSPAERVEFLYEVTKAFYQEDSYRDVMGYTKSKEGKPDVIQEWWGVLCQDYFSFPTEFRGDTSPAEYALVEKWVKRMDQNYNPVEAKVTRMGLMEHLAHASAHSKNTLTR